MGASSRVATHSIPNPYRGAQGRNWRCALLLRLPGSFVPPRPWHWTIPVHPTVFSAACKKAASCRPATCAVHLPTPSISSRQSSPGQRRRVASSSLSLLHNPALDHLKSHQSRPLSEAFCHANHLPNLSGQSYSQNHLAPNTPSASLLLTLFSLTATQQGRSCPLN